ncbi:major facilitator superfamily-domain-containing protein [Staphylotrichum tortipilum]|uniref:Major facilitator superfamily-domain-containing protein n=1 Tax=Staphylotrichum tortipilum TaxID=2831512 RepID=A0AAN6MK07_9PEZI|nr:major facilitator superfamily-domain-containing protein [Staphylotrichum longicolle]
MRPTSPQDASKGPSEYTSGVALPEADPEAAPTAAPNDSTTSTPPSAAFHQPMTGLPLYAILISICIGSFLLSTDVFIISTAIPSITTTFHDTTLLPWYPASYSLTTSTFLPLTGILPTLFPLAPIYQTFLLLFLAGSALCGAAPTVPVFIAGRALAGVGAAGVATAGLAVVLAVTPPGMRAMGLGMVSGAFALGVVLAPVVGGAFAERGEWRWAFWVNLPVGAVTVGCMVLFFRGRGERGQKGALWERVRRVDFVGGALLVPACFLVLLAMQWGGVKYPWRSGMVIGLFAGGGLLLVAFIVWERHMGDHALIPGSVVRRRAVALGCAFAFCQMGGLAVMSYYLPEWFQAVQGVGPMESGVRVLPSVISQIVGIVVVGAFAVRARFYNPWLFVGSTLMCIAAGLYTTFTAFNTPSRAWIGFQILQGLGVGLTMQVSTLILQQELEGSPLLPVGVSLGLFSQYLGATVSQVVAGSIFNTSLRRAFSEAGLGEEQVGLLLQSGTAHVRQAVETAFPDLLVPVLDAYNFAISRVYFVPVVTSVVAFVVASFLRWRRIEGDKAENNQSHEPQADDQGVAKYVASEMRGGGEAKMVGA